jgi:hypothetical protein
MTRRLRRWFARLEREELSFPSLSANQPAEERPFLTVGIPEKGANHL